MASRFHRIFAPCIISIMVILALVGCGVGNPDGGTTSSSIPHLVPCNNPAATFYQVPQNFNILTSITTSFSSDPNAIYNQQIASWELLIYEIKKWSVSHDVKSGEATYRFTVTLLSPELITSLILAEFTFNGSSNLDVLSELNKWTLKRQNNQQIVFLLTVNSSDQSAFTEPDKQAVHIPIAGMSLKTMSGVGTSQPQAEGIFNYVLDSYDGRIQYYFYFPTAVLINDICTTLIEPDRDLTFTLGISNVEINSAKIGDLSWNFDVAHLLNMNNKPDIPPLPQEDFLPSGVVLPVGKPVCNMPAVTANSSGDIYYWMRFSLCVWERLSGLP